MSILWVDDEIENIKTSNWLPPEIYTSEKDFTKAQNIIKSHSIIKYDAIILDINLEKSETTPEINILSKSFNLDSEDFKKEAGFHLFINLIESGYPKEKILCFSGNADPEPIEIDFLKLKIEPDKEKKRGILKDIDEQMDSMITNMADEVAKDGKEFRIEEDVHPIIQSHINQLYLGKDTTKTNTYGEFSNKFFAARITPPVIIPKMNSDLLSSWVDSVTLDDYVQLRRLLIDYSLFLIDELEHNNLEIHERLEINEKFRFNNNEAISLLENVIHLLPIQKPESKSKLNHYFKQLVFIISHHWDNLEWPAPKNFNIDYKNDSTPEKEKKIALQCFFIIMKTVRNWSHHGDIFEKIDERTLAYLFLINARALFDLDRECSPHETKLLKFICQPEDPMGRKEFKKKCGDSLHNRKLAPNRKYARIHNKFQRPWDLEINKILNESVNSFNKDKSKYTKKNLIDGLYDCFWFLTSTPGYKYRSASATDRYSVQLEIIFHFFNYEALPFISDFSRHLFYNTFIRLTIEEMHEIAKDKGGRCLSTEYVNNNTNLDWECAEEHQWKATPSNIEAGKWCQICSETTRGKNRKN